MNRSTTLRRCLSRTTLVFSLALLTSLAGLPSALAQINQYLPFDMPSTATLRASPKKVFAHYFTPFPLRIGNGNTDPTNDYYTTQYLLPNGENGIHTNRDGSYYGGYLRERPLPLTPTAVTNFDALDMQTEVSRAIAIGLDGFTVDLLLGTVNSNRVRLMLNAANTVDTGFKIVLMPDMASITDSNTLTTAITNWATYPACYHLADGRLVVAPYNAQNQTTNWWAGWLAKMSNSYNIKIAFVPVFQGWQTYATNFAPISYGFSDWGERNATANLAPGWTNAASLAHGWVTNWMHPVSAQDERPKDDAYWEAVNSANFRYTWERGAIGKADWVQIPTWNDYSECSEISPSTGIQYAFYDLAAFYTCWFKSNTPPAIVRDCIYYFHRQANTSALPPIQNTTNLFKIQFAAPSNYIEAYVFATNTVNTSLQIVIAGVTNTYPITGSRTIIDAPLQEGQPIFNLVRNSQTVASVQTLFIISNTIPYQDMLYHAGSSLRPPITQVPNAYWPRNLTLPPAAPTGLGLAVASASKVVLSWTASANATSYTIERSMVSGGPYTVIATGVAGTTYTDIGLAGGTTYFYVIYAVDAGGNSAVTAEDSATTIPDAPTGLSAIAGNGTVILDWTACLGAPSYNVKRATVSGGPYTTIGSGVTTTSYTNTSLANGTTYYFVVSAEGVNMEGESSNSTQVAVTPSASVPSPWQARDIGAVGQAGSSSYGEGVFTVSGSGYDIFYGIDAFQYVDQPCTGSVSVVAQVLTQQHTTGWAKAGVMIRESLSANSIFADVVMSPSNGIAFQWRSTTGGGSSDTNLTGFTAPYWVKLTRATNTFSAYYSPDGLNWTQLGPSQTFTMATNATVGLAVTSQNTNILGTATFGNVSIAPVPSPWQARDIGAVGQAGSSSYGEGVFTVSGSGYDIFYGIDAFQYVDQPCTGSVSVVAQVLTQQHTTGWAKAGVMIRESLSANSIFADVVMSPSNGIAFQWRSTTGGGSSDTNLTGFTAPYWVKLTRATNTFSAYYSPDGLNWTQLGPSQTFTMATNATVGLAVTSQNTNILGTATFGNVSIAPVPSPWQARDIGAVGQAGSSSYGEGVFTVSGSGYDIFYGIDAFQYVDQPCTGSVSVVAQVLTQQHTTGWAKAGVMIRESLSANSIFADVVMSPSNGIAFQWRSTTGGGSSDTNLTGFTAPYWVKLTRATNTFSAYYSPDGLNWTQLGPSQTFTMATNATVGLAVTSQNTNILGTATFGNVTPSQ